MAPEVVKNDHQGYSAKIDIWSLGCVVLEMWAGRRPWNQENVLAVMFKVRSSSTVIEMSMVSQAY
jgi:serine/threonine protein kinase